MSEKASSQHGSTRGAPKGSSFVIETTPNCLVLNLASHKDFSNSRSAAARTLTISSSWIWICLCTSAIWKRTSPAEREDRTERDAINKKRGVERGGTNAISPVLEEATNIVQKWNMRPCSHTQNRWGGGRWVCLVCVCGDGGGGSGGVTGPDDGGDQTWINGQTNDWQENKVQTEWMKKKDSQSSSKNSSLRCLKQKSILYVALVLMKTQPLNQDLYRSCATEQSKLGKEMEEKKSKSDRTAKSKAQKKETWR